MRVAVGLVVKGGKEFIKKWISCAEKMCHVILVVDNGADPEVRKILIETPKVKRYLIQKDLERNQSRDYQKILDMAREEDCQWVWNLDIDEYVPKINEQSFALGLLNCQEESVGFPLFEMRNDDKHYVMVYDPDKTEKHARLVHKCYKTLSHFKFDDKDKHGVSIPHNCKAGPLLFIPIQHFGHYTKKMRDEKRKVYILNKFKDKSEMNASWMEEDESKIILKEFKMEDWENMGDKE